MYHHQIGTLNFSHCFHILCAWGSCTIIGCRFPIYPGEMGFCLFYYCAVLWCGEIFENPMVVCVCLHITIIMQMYLKVLNYWNGNHVHTVVRLSQFSQLSFMRYMEMCVFSVPIFGMMIVKIHYLIIIAVKSEIWRICHCLRLGHETMICAVYHFIFLHVVIMVWICRNFESSIYFHLINIALCIQYDPQWPATWLIELL